MSLGRLTCDQAIFTSIRTPTGEGYRIIAASHGLRADEKRTITRSSPSHDALCWSASENAGATNDVYGAAFYPLPGGRRCVAYCRYAGAEHTGRGGHRVYTYNVIFDQKDFPLCAYNPFTVLRAMGQAGLTSPQLKPPAVLPELQLPITDAALAVADGPLPSSLTEPWRSCILQSLIEDGSLIVNVETGWTQGAEALLMGLPGPMRAEVSLGAGLRFSIGRCHHLSLLFEDQAVIKSRIAGKPVRYIDPRAGEAPATPTSEWISFVQRHWARGTIASLARRTSRPFGDVSMDGRERIGRLYNDMDAIPHTRTDRLLHVVGDRLKEPEDRVEADIAGELVTAAQHTILDRLRHVSWDEVHRYWDAICNLWRQSAEGCLFVQPLIEKTLDVVTAQHPIVAAEAALKLADPVPPTATEQGHAALLDRVLTRLADWAQGASDAKVSRLSHLCDQWAAVRPQCPIVARLQQRCTAVPSGTHTA